jgi:hypothetical protein
MGISSGAYNMEYEYVIGIDTEALTIDKLNFFLYKWTLLRVA